MSTTSLEAAIDGRDPVELTLLFKTTGYSP